MTWRLPRNDVLFLVRTLMPGRRDVEGTADLLRGDETLIETMLDDEQLFERLMNDDEILLHASPYLFFSVLLRRVRHDLEGESFTVERRHQQWVLLFDTDRVVELLAQDTVRDYLAAMLASFVRIESRTVRYPVRPGIWRRYRTSELDVHGMMRHCQTLDESLRFKPYRRIGDVCLFMAGMFPEHIDARHRYPMSGQVRPGARGRTVVTLEDYEAHGSAFYQLAAEHEMAHTEGLDEVLSTLSEHFILAEKPLTYVANHYLRLARTRLFEM